MPDQSNLIYTNSLTCAAELSKLSRPSVHILGGTLNRYSMSICGIRAYQDVLGLNFDQAVMGVTSYCEPTGFNCGVEDEAVLKRTVMRHAEQTVILMDSSKVDVKNTYAICTLADADVIISDGNLPEEFLEECRRYDVQVF